MSGSPKKAEAGSKKARAKAARMAAVQAVYQMGESDQGCKLVIDEFLLHRLGKPVDGHDMVLADGVLFRAIVEGTDARREELSQIIGAALQKQARYRVGDDGEPPLQKAPEALLNAILLCGAFELLAHHDTDAPLIINDYLDVAHGFYERGEVSLVNALLDTVMKAVR